MTKTKAVTADTIFNKLRKYKGRFKVEHCGFVRHKKIKEKNGWASACPLNILCRQKKRYYLNTDIKNMAECLGIKYRDALKIVWAADSRRSKYRKKLLSVLGIQKGKTNG